MAATPAFQAHATLNPQPNPVEPPPSLGAVPSASGIEAKPAPPSEFAVDVPPPPPPPPGLEPNPPQQAETTQTVTFSNPSTPQAQNTNSPNETLVQTAVKPSSNKIMPVMIALALVVFFLVWAFLWITILGLKF